jgi:hypothetical protein
LYAWSVNNQHTKEKTKMASVFPFVSVKQGWIALQRQLPGKLRQLAAFGWQALVLTPFVSCNANARMTGSGTTAHAAEMRMFRLLRHVRLASLLLRAVRQALPLDGRSVLNVDFSNFGGVAVLVAALQTNKGRALPWALEALVSNTQGIHADKPGYVHHKAAYQAWKRETSGDQYDAVLRQVAQIDDKAAAPPCLVFDRGFGNKRLLTALFARQGKSYVRMRDDCRVEVDKPGGYWDIWHVRELPPGDYQVRWLGLSFRLVVVTTRRQAKDLAPWAIATNDRTSTPEQIAKLYYHRFEIEETFRNWKSGLGLRRARFTRWQSLQVLLSFASVAVLLAWQAADKTTADSAPRVHPKKQLSFFRRWHEQLQRQVSWRRPAALTGG